MKELLGLEKVHESDEELFLPRVTFLPRWGHRGNKLTLRRHFKCKWSSSTPDSGGAKSCPSRSRCLGECCAGWIVLCSPRTENPDAPRIPSIGSVERLTREARHGHLMRPMKYNIPNPLPLALVARIAGAGLVISRDHQEN